MFPMQQRIRPKVRRSVRFLQPWNRELQLSATFGTPDQPGAYSLSKDQPKRYIARIIARNGLEGKEVTLQATLRKNSV